MHITKISKASFGNSLYRKEIVIFDDFEGKDPEAADDINNDGKPELWHGLKVKGALLASGTHKKLPRPIEIQNTDSIIDFNKIIEMLVNLPSSFGWINSSLGFFLNLEEMSILAEEKITKENIKDKKEKITKDIKFKYYDDEFQETTNYNEKPKFLKASDLLNNLKKLAKNIKFYTSAGNWGDTFCNMYSMAEGVKTIGGLDTKGNPHIESGNNSLISKDNWAPYEFVGKLIVDKNGNKGYDIAPKGQNGDREVDIELSEINLTGTNPPNETIEYAGTSYSTPYKLGKDYLAQNKKVTHKAIRA